MIRRQQVTNQLLLGLAQDDFERMVAKGQLVELEGGEILYEAESPVDTVWFPETGLISVISVMLSGAMIETSVVGREGGLGFIEAAGGGIMFSRAVVQVHGRFLRVPATAYRAAFDASPGLRRSVQNHVELLVTEVRQAMACIALHKAEQRLAWWLLEAQDRIGGHSELPLTQEFLAVMLGVRRATVNVCARELEDEGLISHRRGRITVLDRDGLERRSCECYATTVHFRHLIETTGAQAKAVS